MTAARLRQAVETLASKGEKAAYRQALRDVLEDIEAVKYAQEDDWGNFVICKVELTAKIKARLEL